MSQESPEAYLKTIISSITFLSETAKKQAFKRGLDVLPEIHAFRQYKGGIHEIRDIVREELRAGIQRYLIGFFDDSIHHSTLSVEMGLLIRLEETLSKEDKDRIHSRINGEGPYSFTFGAIFDESKKRGRNLIKDKEIERLIGQIIFTRNTHIHAGNFTAASILSMQNIGPGQIDFGLEKLAELQNSRLIKLVTQVFLSGAKDQLIETRTTVTNFPTLEWCTKDNQRHKSKEEMDNYFTEVFYRANSVGDDAVTIADKVRIGVKSKQIIKDISADTYSRRKALETIHDSFEVLKSLGFFKEP